MSRKRGGVVCDVVDPPYKIRFPGYRSRLSDYRFNLRTSADPRLGTAQRAREEYFKTCRLEGYPKYSATDGTSDVENEPDTEEEDSSDDDIETVQAKDDDPLPTWSKAELAALEKEHMLYQKKLYRRSVKNEARYLKEQDCTCAEEAIKFFNKNHGTKYEIVETLGSYSHLAAGCWFHCNFKAAQKGATNLFFAELNSKIPDQYNVINCKKLDGSGPRPDTVRGCKFCSGPLVHPINGFKVGK